MSTRFMGAVSALFCLGAVLVAACSDDGRARVTIGSDCESEPCSAPPNLGGAADAAVDSATVGLPALLCIGTECPYPYASCDGFSENRCETDLSNDPKNCGACKNVCPPNLNVLNALSGCVDGACKIACIDPAFGDCNGLIDDGCEVFFPGDPNHCGVCGNKCGDGEPCFRGTCGCPAGLTNCGGTCVDTTSNKAHCGECFNACTDPSSACNPLPPYTGYVCGDSKCGVLGCVSPPGEERRDCNKDFVAGCASDGCEINVASDVNNCGKCGNVCGPGQICAKVGNQDARCLCDAGDTLCIAPSGLGACIDLLSDPENCGACGHACPSERAPNVERACQKGACSTECARNWADCDGDSANGCEVNLAYNSANCGACGKRCDVAAGQPCISGKCLMTECGPGETK